MRDYADKDHYDDQAKGRSWVLPILAALVVVGTYIAIDQSRDRLGPPCAKGDPTCMEEWVP